MKNYIKLFGLIALVAVIGFSMIACDDDDNSDSIVGTWVGSYSEESVDVTITLTVKADGTGTSAISVEDVTVLSQTFKWSQSGSTITFVFDEDEDEEPQTITYTGGNSFTVDGITFNRK